MPMFVSFGLVSSLAYLPGLTITVKCLHVAGLVLCHLCKNYFIAMIKKKFLL